MLLPHANDIICAPATSEGGAISLVRVSGAGCLESVDSVVRLRRGSCSAAAGFSLHFGCIEGLDEVIVSVFRAPHSYTGEDMAEISCHASTYIVRELLSRLCAAGCRMAGPGEFTRRAFAAGKMDLAQAEAVADLIAADSAASHRLALAQMRGAYSLKLKELRQRLVEISALLELELDFSEEEVEFADRRHLEELVSEALGETEKMADSFRLGNAFKNGIPVALAGAVNSGKSTLLNALLGEDRAIVSDIPGTTRDTVEEVLTLNGIKYRFIDTAGLRETPDEIEKLGIERSFRSIEQARVAVVLLDGTAGVEELSVVVGIVNGCLHEGTRVIWVRSKADLVSGAGAGNAVYGGSGCKTGCNAPGVADFGGSGCKSGDFAPEDADSGEPGCDKEAFCTRLGIPDVIDISALTGQGLDELREAIACADADTLNASDAIMVTNQRHFEALRNAATDLRRFLEGLSSGLSSELIAEDLRSGLSALGSIFGEILPDDILGEVFSRFCIGK